MSTRGKLVGTITAMLTVFLALCFCSAFLLFAIAIQPFAGAALQRDLRMIAARYFVAAGLIVMLFIGAGLFWILSWSKKNLAMPMENLKKATAAIQAGELSYELRINEKTEFAELEQAFELMRINLKNSRQQLEAVENERRILLANICHDLKTPVTSILGYSEGILDAVASTPEKIMDYSRIINNKARQLSRLIEDINLLSQLEGAPPLSLETVNMQSYLEGFAEELRAQAPCEIITELSDGIACLIDKVRFERVLLNIAQNSFKYGKPAMGEALLKISLMTAGDDAIISVQDNGPGIEPKDLQKVFERFYRSDPARNTGDGSGLGLAIARQIVQLHKGKIWVVNRKEGGFSVNISLKKR